VIAPVLQLHSALVLDPGLAAKFTADKYERLLIPYNISRCGIKEQRAKSLSP
jgi:hypothetical protein